MLGRGLQHSSRVRATLFCQSQRARAALSNLLPAAEQATDAMQNGEKLRFTPQVRRLPTDGRTARRVALKRDVPSRRLSWTTSPRSRRCSCAPWRTRRAATAPRAPPAAASRAALPSSTSQAGAAAGCALARKVRQHVNPLSSGNAAPVPPPSWAALFPDASKPLALDLGTGAGRFVLALATSDTARARNYLGVEIRAPLALRADAWASKLSLPHARFRATNANVNIDAWLASYPGPLDLVSILHPDPHWKRRHRKRRIVQPALAAQIVARLAPGGQVFLQSDVKAVAQAMVAVFQQASGGALALHPSHFGPGATPDWPPPGAERINQGDDVQRDAARRASARKRRAKRADAAAAAAATAAAAAAGAAKAAAVAADAAPVAAPEGVSGAAAAGDDDGDGEGDCDGDDGGRAGSSDEDGESFSGWAALPGHGWLRDNPTGVPTERELGTAAAGGHVWRALLVKKGGDKSGGGGGGGGGGAVVAAGATAAGE